MRAVVMSSRSFLIQNGLATLVFTALLFTQTVTYLLYLYPGSELLWALTINGNRMFGPVFQSFDFEFGLGPLAAIAVLSAMAIFPAVSLARNSWLGTAVAGHVALATCVVLTAGAMQRASVASVTASLVPVIEHGMRDSRSVFLALMTIALVVLCLLNHVVFFRQPR